MRTGSSILLACLVAFGAPGTSAQNLDSARMLDHVRYLAQDDLAGRESGDPGADSAAAYIAAVMKQYGLQPLFDDGSSYRQTFELVTTIRVEPTSRLILQTPEGSATLTLGSDWYPFSFASSGKVAGRVARTGFGLSESDFESLKSSRATVALIDGDVPEGWNPHTGGDPSLRRRATLARDAGAEAVLIVVDEIERPQAGDIPRSLGIPVLQIVAAPTSEQLLASEYLRVALTADITPIESTVYNVGGRVAGTDPGTDVIVFGAHYDHLGLGGPGSLAPDVEAPHNGADDNASGTALLLELARYFSAHKSEMSSDVAFVAFTAEEMGLLGSAHFVANPPFPVDQIEAMLNFDMVGRLREGKLQIFGTETAEEFGGMLDSASKGRNLTISRVGDGYGPSDQTSFYAHGVPVLHFFSGTHSEYHRPEDDWELINADGMAEIGELAIDLARRIADRTAALTFVEQQRPAAGSGRGYGPYFGTIPDFSPVEGGGLAITGVRPGSPAEEAGLTGGDVVIRFAGKEVTSINDYAYALREHAPGDTVSVAVRRAGEVLEMTAVLGKR